MSKLWIEKPNKRRKMYNMPRLRMEHLPTITRTQASQTIHPNIPHLFFIILTNLNMEGSILQAYPHPHHLTIYPERVALGIISCSQRDPQSLQHDSEGENPLGGGGGGGLRWDDTMQPLWRRAFTLYLLPLPASLEKNLQDNDKQ